MRSMLAATGDWPQLRHFVKLIFAGRIAQPVQPAARAIDHRVQTAECPLESLRRRDGYGQMLDFHLFATSRRRRRDTAKSLPPFIAGDDPALVIEGDADPRTPLRTRHREEPLHPKSRQDEERIAGSAKLGWC